MKMKIVIIGAGTTAIAVADILVHDRNFKIVGFIGTTKENEKLGGQKIYGEIPFLGDRSLLKKLKDDAAIVGFVAAIGDNYIREEAFYEGIGIGIIPINAISPHAVIEPSAQIEKGIIVSAGCIVSHGVTIGNNTYLDSGVIVDIYTEIGENCHLNPGCIIGGMSEIGRNVTIGSRSTIAHNVKIGKNQKIMAGEVVNKDIEDLIRNQE
jgi:sugar O-acyltransferase (sialic acid O-acetyltransferase NeuD family)|tara:strand:+ start:1857 stop:2483 length:627 start_codon:yes stop_codon:yes gene_type:complete